MKNCILLSLCFFIQFLSFTELNAQCPTVGCMDDVIPGNTPLMACISCDLGNLNGFSGSTGSTGTTPAPAVFCGSVENNIWFPFAAPTASVTFEITASNCAGTPMGSGIQAEVYSSEGCIAPGDFTSVSNCWSSGAAGTGTVTATGLIPGGIYYLMIDGWAGDICDFSINITDPTVFGDPPPLPAPTDIMVNGALCIPSPSGSTNFSVPQVNGISSYNWTITPMNGFIVSDPTLDNIDVNILAPGDITICASGNSICADGGEYCETFTIVDVPPAFPVIEYCLGQATVCGDQNIPNPTPGPTTVVMTSYLGCDSLVNCILIPVPPITEEADPITVCGPASIEHCGETHTSSGVYFDVCTNYQGCDSTSILDLAILEPIPVASALGELGCDASSLTVEVSGVGSNIAIVPNGNTIFQWSGPSFCGPTDQIIACVDQPGLYCLTLTHERDGVSCSEMACVDVFENSEVPFPPIISGPEEVCDGDMSIYTVTSGGGPAPIGYTWTSPNGEPINIINGTTVEIDWTASMGGQLCVTADNDCGSSAPTCLTIVVSATAEDPILDGPSMVCPNDNPTFSVLNADPEANYAWTAPAGAFINGSGSMVTIDFSNAATGDVCVTATTECGSSNQICQTVTLLSPPSTPSLLSGNMIVCSGQTEMYCVNDIGDADDWTWTTPIGDFPNFGDCVDLDWTNSGGGEICVTANNNCGSSASFCFIVTVDQAPSATLSGGGAICQGSGETVDLTINLTGVGPWDLIYNDGTNDVSLNIVSTPHTLTVSTPGTYTLISLSDQTNCPGIVNGQAVVDDNPQPTVALSGSGAICQGSGVGVDLTITLTGTPDWIVQWTVDGNAQADLNITSSPFTLTINETQAGDIELVNVVDGNGCSNTGDGNIINIPVNSAPTVSNISTTCNVTNDGYVVTFDIMGGDVASYAVSPTTGVLDMGTFTSVEIPSGTGYSFNVTDANNCNPILVEDPSVLCDCTTAVGSMDATTINECGDGPVEPVYDNTDEMFDGDDVLVYILHEGSGISIVNSIAINAMSPSFMFDSGTMTYGTTYYISAVVGNDDMAGGVDLDDDCLAVAQGTPVIFYEIPTATLSDEIDICIGQSGGVTITFTGTGPWNIEYDDGDANTPTEIINGITANPFSLNVSPSETTTYSLVTVSSTNVAITCDGTVAGTATIIVNTEIVVTNEEETCNLTATGYAVTFDITGGDETSYAVTGTISGTIMPGNPAVFTSEEIPTGQGYSFTITDANGCNTVFLEQANVICDCTTDVGVMDANLLENCGDDAQTATYDNTDEMFDGNDVLIFILHDNSTANIGNIFQTNTTNPTFSFDVNTMNYGTTYYISAVVGDDDMAGGIDQDDLCLAVAAGTPVVWYQIPSATLMGDASICNGNGTGLNIELSGSAPWIVTIINNLGFEETVTEINTNPFIFNVSPTEEATYSISAIQDANDCDGTITGEALIQVNEAPTTTAPIITFNATNTGYTVSFEIQGGDETSYTVSPDLGTISAGPPYIFTSNEFACGTGFNFMVDDANECGPAVVAQAEVICSCETEAGQMDDTNIENCGDGPIVAAYGGGETLDGDDVASFILRDGNDLTIGSSTEPSFSFNPGTMTYGETYFICPVAGNGSGNGTANPNDPCYSIGTMCTEVVFQEIPTATVANDGSICAGVDFELTVELTGVGPWTIEYVNNSTMETFTETGIMASPHPLFVSPNESAVFTISSVTDANGCQGMGSGLANVTVTSPPVAGFITETCNATNTEYVVTFQITLGDAPTYQVMPMGAGTLDADGLFTSNPIPTGDTYEYFVDDANGCGPFVVSGQFTCDCVTEAGTIVETEIEICGDAELAEFTHTGFILDPDDILEYVLHDGSAAPIGNIFATSTDPSFSFQTGMDLNTTYLITAIVGSDDGMGGVDLDDPCLGVLNIPVTFFDFPTIEIDGGETLCQAAFIIVNINFSLSGNGPFDITYTENGEDGSYTGVNDGFISNHLISETTIFNITSITDANGCSTDVDLEAAFTVVPDPNAGSPNDTPEFCVGEDATVMLDNLLTGADAGGSWTDGNGNPVDPTVGTINLSIGEYLFNYTVQSPPCDDAVSQVSIIINDSPVANAGSDEVLTCTQEEVLISGNPSPGNVSYQWDGPSVISPNDLETFVTAPGIYTLTVLNNDTGCSATDEMEVTQDFIVPEMVTSVTNITCFGDNNGIIVIDSVENGKAPYSFSFNGGQFSSNTVYPNLTPGDYSIIVQDANGCEDEVVLSVFEPAELTVSIDGGFMDDETLIALGDSVYINIEENPNFPFFDLESVQWTGNVDCDTCQGNWVKPEIETTYSVTIENDGCIASDEITIFVQKDLEIYIANIFSPNDDGVNDILAIHGNENIIANVNSFQIFNRWGEVVYVLLNHPVNDISPEGGWDGKHRDEKVDVGVYVWFAEVLFVDGTTKIFKGDVMVIR